MIRRPPRSTLSSSSAASDVYKRQYVLASNRSSYDLATVVGEHLGRALEHGAGAGGAARAIAELAPKLEAELEATGALDVFRRCEMALVPVLVRMEEVGVGVDRSVLTALSDETAERLSLIHISEPTRLGMISYAVFC